MRDRVINKIGDSRLCFSFVPSDDLDGQIEFAFEHGATHFNIGQVPFRYDAFMPDNSDPYPNWSQGSIGLFRVFPPPALEKHIPREIVETNLEYLDKAVASIRKFGLRCNLEGKEPLWLPESVYREHPHWRGGQCELGRIAAKPYFTPAIDEPEVLDLYSRAMKEWCLRYPEFDYFFFWTNDCGSGLPWSTYQYPGINGPARHRLINPGKRMRGWFEALNQGIASADCRADVNIASFSFTPSEFGAIRAELPENAYFNSINSKGESAVYASASLMGTIDTPNCSVPGILSPFSFVGGLQKVLSHGKHGELRKISLDESNKELVSALIKAVLDAEENPHITLFEKKASALAAIAGKLYSEEEPDAIIEAWGLIDKANGAISQIRQRGIGAGIALSSTTARWLYRPLVPKPLELTAKEKTHYEPYLFSCATDKMNANLCFVLGKPIFIGDSVVWMMRWAVTDAVNHIRSAIATVEAAIAKPTDESALNRLTLLVSRLKTWICILQNARLTIMYQHALDISGVPKFGRNHMDFDDNIQFDQRALELRKIAREDLDNTMELVDLLENNEKDLLGCSVSKEEETVFRYGPDIVSCLRKKMDIMLDHWPDYEKLYPTSKVYEFEPDTEYKVVEENIIICDK